MSVSEKGAAVAAADGLATAASAWQRHVCGVTACLPDNAHAARDDVPVDVQRRLGLASRDGVTTLGATGVWTHDGAADAPAALLVPASLLLAVRAHRRRFSPSPDGGGGGGGGCGGGRTVVVEGFKLSGSAASFDLTVLRAYRCVFGAQSRAALERVEAVPGREVEEVMDGADASSSRLSHCLCRVSLSRSGCDGVFGVEEVEEAVAGVGVAAAAAVAGTSAELTYDGLSTLLVGAGAAAVSWQWASEEGAAAEEEQGGPSVELVLGHAFCSGTPVLGALFDVWVSGGRGGGSGGRNVHSCMEGALVVRVGEGGGGGRGATSTPCVLACTPTGGWASVPLAAFGGAAAAAAAALPQVGDSSRESKALSGSAAERVLSVFGGGGSCGSGGFVDDASFVESVGFVKCTFDGDGGDGDGRGTLSQADGRCSAGGGGGDGRHVVHDRVAVQSSKRGSCVRLSESVYVTNAHVVAPEAAHHVLSRVTVSQPARRGTEAALPSFGAAYEMRVSPATLAFASKGSVDAAMLVANGNPAPVQPGSGLRLATAPVHVGHPVAVVGFPQGDREPVEVSHGVVTRVLDGCYVVSAKVQPGCSGGGLFSRLSGECLGMATACLHDEAGKVLVPDIGLCVPASDLLPFLAAVGGGGTARLESTYNTVSFEREALWQLSVGGSAADTLRALNKHVLRMQRGVRVPAMPASMKGSALFNYTRAVLSEATPDPAQHPAAEGEVRAKL
eukprot:Rhum_TRINITY_DN14942_c7_g3::Rhum_TRINITY_DN14942_c7_g3_i1::g.126743::m.126743